VKSTDLQVTLGRKVGPNQAVALGPTQAGVLNRAPQPVSRRHQRRLQVEIVRDYDCYFGVVGSGIQQQMGRQIYV
jgi:hypothetical protein